MSLPYYFIPYSLNSTFFGREAELRLSRDALAASPTTGSPNRFVFHGIGGVGKTSIALQLAYDQKNYRKIVMWFNADNTDKLDRRFSEIANAIGLHQSNPDLTRDREALKRWLEGTGISV